MVFIKAILLFIFSNSFSVIRLLNLQGWLSICIFITALVYVVAFNVKPTFKEYQSKKLRRIKSSIVLLESFLILIVADAAWLIFLIYGEGVIKKDIVINSIIVIAELFILFWNGIIRAYLFSTQIGLKWRIIGIVCGMIPIINIIVLIKIIRIINFEYKTENAKITLNNARKKEQICKTNYPILLVHGVFFRDFRFFNYWGRIPEELKKNGAEIYYGNQQSAGSVEECGREIAERIKEIVKEKNCGKVNIIAHSKGGLDSRYAISLLGSDEYVASLTTINTPHKGCQFADYILNIAPEKLKNTVADKYNKTLKKLGDKNPDFLAAVYDLTAESCMMRNEICLNSEKVYYQSLGSKAEKSSGNRFPLNLSYHLVKYFDGDNDGLVSVESMKWGEKFVLFKPENKRGISHGDMIDLNRENIVGFDVRETYVNLVNELKKMGY